KYSCTTGESEFIGLVSIVPENNTCAPNDYGTNLYPYSLFNLFKHEDYQTYAFHNWYDEFYDRHVVYQNMGANAYYNKNDLNITEYKGWPSDVELLDQAYDIIDKTKPFYAHIVTSSTHFPYDQASWAGDLNLAKINEIHPDYPMEVKRYLSKAMVLDEALNHLINDLKADDLLKDTIILIYADHHPLKMDYDTIQTCSYMDRTTHSYSIDHTPLIIYGADIQPQTFSQLCSTFDIVPTLANLMGIEFDPRFYIGNDYFAPNKQTMTIFANGDFLIEEGYYSNVEEKFYPFADQQISDEQLNYYQILAKNKINVSSKILRNDYFAHRNFIDQPISTNSKDGQ
ncbi:MAG: LTA synthase family protein, partial [Erysipelotrichaceae bacterium]|nr:LTA synthase family protein [Erysipelotrichaceae bacterium]